MDIESRSDERERVVEGAVVEVEGAGSLIVVFLGGF
jgi:hypothetical protein